MILKIERYSDEQRWRIFDEIREISISDRLSHNGIPEVRKDTDVVIFDVGTDCECGSGGACSNCVDYYLLICRLSSGEEYSIAFDTVAYLLNDSGKTIEKIVANYDNK